MVDDRLFDQLHSKMRQVAQPILATAAHEILVLGATAPSDFGEDQAAGAFASMTSVAEQEALQVVVMYPVALASPAASMQHFLYPLKQFRRDDRLVSARVDVVFVDHEPDVVRIAEHVVQLAARHWLFWIAFRRPGSQPQIGHRGFQPLDRVLVRGVQLECPVHQRCPLRVDGDAVDQRALVIHPHIQIAQAGAGDGAA
ncbi:hypothetical protein V7968_16280 [Nocardia vulneris]